MNVLSVMMTLILSLTCVKSFRRDEEIIVRNRGLFKIEVSIAGSEADRDTLLFDTGSPFTWLYHYRYVRDILKFPPGGYGTTKLSTRILPPEGGQVIKYADETVYEATVWTLRNFTMGEHTWVQPFGIVDRTGQVERNAQTTGLLGASRSSAFVNVFPIFGFRPTARGTLSMRLSVQDPSAVCHEGKMSFFTLVQSGRYAVHWATDTTVQFNKVVLKTGVIFDTGASVLGLNSVAFKAFTHQLDSLNISFKYSPDHPLSGEVDCADVRHLPSWEIHHQNGVIHITPQMYVAKRSASMCRLQVAHISGGHPIVLGTPLLGNIVSEFDLENGRVGICRPSTSFITDYDHTPGMNDYNEVQDCPSCNPGNNSQRTVFSLFVPTLLAFVCLVLF